VPFLVCALFGSCYFWFVPFLVWAVLDLCPFWFRALFGSCPIWFMPYLDRSVFGSCCFWFMLKGHGKLKNLYFWPNLSANGFTTFCILWEFQNHA
jgi:hypothetical protein